MIAETDVFIRIQYNNKEITMANPPEVWMAIMENVLGTIIQENIKKLTDAKKTKLG